MLPTQIRSFPVDRSRQGQCNSQLSQLQTNCRGLGRQDGFSSPCLKVLGAATPWLSLGSLLAYPGGCSTYKYAFHAAYGFRCDAHSA